MKLQSCARTLSFPLVGVGLLTCFFFTPDRYATGETRPTLTAFPQILWDGCESRKGLRQLSYMKEMKMGDAQYELIALS
jgi:predicted membrane protein